MERKWITRFSATEALVLEVCKTESYSFHSYSLISFCVESCSLLNWHSRCVAKTDYTTGSIGSDNSVVTIEFCFKLRRGICYKTLTKIPNHFSEILAIDNDSVNYLWIIINNIAKIEKKCNVTIGNTCSYIIGECYSVLSPTCRIVHEQIWTNSLNSLN